jgi:putative transposase
MKTIHKSYKYRLYPTKDQEMLLAKHFGCSRFVFNRFLNERKEEYLNNGNSLSYYDNAKSLTELKNELIWLKDVNSQSLQSALRNLDIAYNRFFKKIAKFPRFKKKTDKQSFHIPQFIDIKNNKLSIPKFKKGIEIVIHRPMEGKILNGTITKTATGKYYVSIVCEVEHQELIKTNSFVGIDTGIKDLAILSDGIKYENIKCLKTSLKKLKYEQRQLSKKIKGSGQRNKQRIKLSLIHEKVANQRKDYLHKVSTEIIKNYDVICVEDLALKNMIKNHKLAQALSDCGLGMLYNMLSYKASWNDKTIVKIDRFFPSSKMCSNCNWIKEDLTLKDREWTCVCCSATHDRDINASKNILLQGLNELSGLGTNSDIKQKQVESSAVAEAVKLEAQGSLALG